MKTLIIAIATLVGLAFTRSTDASLDLDKAINDRIIYASFTGNNGSTHYLKPLKAQIKNLKNKEIEVRIPAGYHFVSTDSTIQDIISTQEQLFALGPKETLDLAIAGMCIQNSNSSPKAEDEFRLGGWANPKLKKMAKYLDQKNIQSCQGQQAMWAISDDRGVGSIVHDNMDGNRELLDVTCDVLGKPRYSDEAYKKLKEQVYNPVYKAELKGKFSFKFSRKVPIHIAIFDDNGIVLKEIYKKEVKPGRHHVEYSFDALPYQGETIHAKLIAFDDVLMDRVIAL